MNTNDLQACEFKKPKLERVVAFDLTRGLHIILMIFIHVLIFYGSPEISETLFGQSVNYLIGWPSASVFTFMMGVLVAYGSTNLKKGLRRALVLFMLGYLLNLFRETIPTLLSLKLGFVTYEQLGIYTPLRGFLVIDIFQYAALAYAICILVKYAIKEVKIWLALAVVVAFGSPLLWDIQTSIPVVNEVLKIFWGNRHQGALFPLFPWLAYPLAGMVFGYWFKANNNDQKLFKYTLLVGIISIIVGLLITLSNPSYHTADIMRHGPGLIIVFLGVVLLWLCLFNFLVHNIKPNKFFELLSFWSKNVTVLFVIHWLFVGWGLMIFGAGQLGIPQVLLWALSVIVLSDLSLRIWLIVTKKKMKSLSVRT